MPAMPVAQGSDKHVGAGQDVGTEPAPALLALGVDVLVVVFLYSVGNHVVGGS